MISAQEFVFATFRHQVSSLAHRRVRILRFLQLRHLLSHFGGKFRLSGCLIKSSKPVPSSLNPGRPLYGLLLECNRFIPMREKPVRLRASFREFSVDFRG